MKRNCSILAAAAALIVPIVFAAESWELPLSEPQLTRAPGVEAVAANCQTCHSADYISTQPPLNRAAWTATVQKMREKYGAPLPTNQVDLIVDFLVKAYGTN